MEDDGAPDIVVIARVRRRARTPKKCLCGGTIHPGDRYTRVIEKVDGELTVVLEGFHIHTFEREE